MNASRPDSESVLCRSVAFPGRPGVTAWLAWCRRGDKSVSAWALAVPGTVGFRILDQSVAAASEWLPARH